MIAIFQMTWFNFLFGEQMFWFALDHPATRQMQRDRGNVKYEFLLHVKAHFLNSFMSGMR